MHANSQDGEKGHDEGAGTNAPDHSDARAGGDDSPSNVTDDSSAGKSDGNSSGGKGSGGKGSGASGNANTSGGLAGNGGSGGKTGGANINDGPSGNGDDKANKQDKSSGGNSSHDGQKESGTQHGTSDGQGIQLGDGSLVSVDDEAHLVLVNPDGGSVVLDNTHAYTVESRDGGVSIRNDAGAGFVSDGKTARFTNAEGQEAEVSSAEDVKKVASALQRSNENETELSGDAEEPSAAAVQANSGKENANATIESTTVAIIAVVILVVAGLVIWLRFHRASQAA